MMGNAPLSQLPAPAALGLGPGGIAPPELCTLPSAQHVPPSLPQSSHPGPKQPSPAPQQRQGGWVEVTPYFLWAVPCSLGAALGRTQAAAAALRNLPPPAPAMPRGWVELGSPPATGS